MIYNEWGTLDSNEDDLLESKRKIQNINPYIWKLGNRNGGQDVWTIWTRPHNEERKHKSIKVCSHHIIITIYQLVKSVRVLIELVITTCEHGVF